MSIRINGVNRDTIRDYIRDDDDLGKVSSKGTNDLTASRGQHGTYHMAAAPNLYEIQRSNNFEFVVFFGEDLLKSGLTLDGGDTSKFKADVAQEVLRMSVSSAFIPHFTQNPIEVKRGNTTIKYAGVPEFQGGDIVLNDYIGAQTKDIICAWQQLSYNVGTERVGLASDYKKRAHLIEYTPDLQKVREWELDGCWVSSISESEYSSDSNDKHQITATITYDKAKLVVE